MNYKKIIMLIISIIIFNGSTSFSEQSIKVSLSDAGKLVLNDILTGKFSVSQKDLALGLYDISKSYNSVIRAGNSIEYMTVEGIVNPELLKRYNENMVKKAGTDITRASIFILIDLVVDYWIETWADNHFGKEDKSDNKLIYISNLQSVKNLLKGLTGDPSVIVDQIKDQYAIVKRAADQAGKEISDNIKNINPDDLDPSLKSIADLYGSKEQVKKDQPYIGLVYEVGVTTGIATIATAAYIQPDGVVSWGGTGAEPSQLTANSTPAALLNSSPKTTDTSQLIGNSIPLQKNVNFQGDFNFKATPSLSPNPTSVTMLTNFSFTGYIGDMIKANGGMYFGGTGGATAPSPTLGIGGGYIVGSGDTIVVQSVTWNSGGLWTAEGPAGTKINITAGPYPTGTPKPAVFNIFIASGTMPTLPAGYGPLSGNLSGPVTGIQGQTFSGTVSGIMTITGSTNTLTMNVSGPVSLGPNKTVDFRPSGTFSTSPTGSSGTVYSGGNTASPPTPANGSLIKTK